MQIFPKIDPTSSGVLVFNPIAKPLFERARQLARRYHLISVLFRSNRNLDCFSEHFSSTVVQNSHRTLAQVLIRQIRGSINRVREFDCDFYPMTNDVEARWVRIASMMLQGKELPPVELVQVGDSYFVFDGHHRISVSHMLGHLYIDAEIQSSESNG